MTNPSEFVCLIGVVAFWGHDLKVPREFAHKKILSQRNIISMKMRSIPISHDISQSGGQEIFNGSLYEVGPSDIYTLL